ncbi:DUF2397 family protein [Pseudonocardia nantongensis]|uniref:DUF2397 family protein n=1 Tax=Pseudonocardia nantongensis TaxID=1181885 RepID=UPI00397BDE2A
MPGAPNDGGLLMDRKYGYGDGALDRWRVADVDEFLFDWCPRKLSATGSSEPDPAKVHLSLRALVDRFTDLAGNAQAFMGSLQRSIDLQDVDVEAFAAYKDQLIDYLQRFVTDLVATGAEIAGLVEEIESHDVGRLLDLAARREAVDAAPGGPAGPDAQDPREAEFARHAAAWRERWAGFRGWFAHERRVMSFDHAGATLVYLSPASVDHPVVPSTAAPLCRSSSENRVRSSVIHSGPMSCGSTPGRSRAKVSSA